MTHLSCTNVIPGVEMTSALADVFFYFIINKITINKSNIMIVKKYRSLLVIISRPFAGVYQNPSYQERHLSNVSATNISL